MPTHRLGELTIVFVFLHLLPAIGFLLLGLAVERIFASIAGVTSRNRAMNISCMTIFLIAQFAIGGTMTIYIIRALPVKGVIHLPGNDHGNLIAALALAVFVNVVYDFFQYWFHRWQHSSKWLWAEHELHHSDECMNVTTTLRHHWLEAPLQAILVAVPAGIIFAMPTITIYSATVLARSLNYFTHLNSKMNLGWLSRVVANPQTHRIHHSRLPEHIDKNFAVVLPLWDILFGTYYHPAKDEFPPTGIADRKTITSVREAMLLPFVTWGAMLRGLVRKSVDAHCSRSNVPT